MKFLNKKEQVFDIQLTPYGKHKLSAGDFKPTYYAFFDDNVAYDRRYFSGSSLELQNDVHKRIKQETQFLESQVLFRETSDTDDSGGLLAETVYEQKESKFTSEGFIGDAKLLAESANVAPAWKVVSMQSNITSSALEDKKNNFKIPQINITASYILKTEDPQDQSPGSQNIRDINVKTANFSDGKYVTLEMPDPLLYLEELNTELLTENFDIEVFEVLKQSGKDDFRKLFFQFKKPQIVNGLLVSERPEQSSIALTTSSVEYYFSIQKDTEVDSSLACKYVDQFNSENYLIDLDFDCSDVDGEDIYFDIYGRVTESEICPD
jgi:hypothetical protein